LKVHAEIKTAWHLTKEYGFKKASVLLIYHMNNKTQTAQLVKKKLQMLIMLDSISVSMIWMVKKVIEMEKK
jgi:hypothetical protein